MRFLSGLRNNEECGGSLDFGNRLRSIPNSEEKKNGGYVYFYRGCSDPLCASVEGKLGSCEFPLAAKVMK